MMRGTVNAAAVQMHSRLRSACMQTCTHVYVLLLVVLFRVF
jgi:hypothetical protein